MKKNLFIFGLCASIFIASFERTKSNFFKDSPAGSNGSSSSDESYFYAISGQRRSPLIPDDIDITLPSVPQPMKLAAAFRYVNNALSNVPDVEPVFDEDFDKEIWGVSSREYLNNDAHLGLRSKSSDGAELPDEEVTFNDEEEKEARLHIYTMKRDAERMEAVKEKSPMQKKGARAAALQAHSSQAKVVRCDGEAQKKTTGFE